MVRPRTYPLRTCAAADLHAVAVANQEVEAHVAVARVPHVLQVRLRTVHRRVVGHDQRTRCELWFKKFQYRKVEIFPPVEQNEANLAVKIRQRGQRVSVLDGNEIVQASLNERL